jgi:hypothetical protein
MSPPAERPLAGVQFLPTSGRQFDDSPHPQTGLRRQHGTFDSRSRGPKNRGYGSRFNARRIRRTLNADQQITYVCEVMGGAGTPLSGEIITVTARFWTYATITAVSALVSASFSVAGLFGPSGSDIFERYATSRSIALLIAVLCCIGFRSRMGIAVLALVMTLVQGFDGLIGALAHDPASTYGPFAFALANFAALVWLLRSGESSNP